MMRAAVIRAALALDNSLLRPLLVTFTPPPGAELTDQVGPMVSYVLHSYGHFSHVFDACALALLCAALMLLPSAITARK